MFSTKKHFENLIFFDIEIVECLNDANSKTLSNEDGLWLFTANGPSVKWQMDLSPRGQSLKEFTSETVNVLHLTLNGIADLLKLIISKSHADLLPGKFSSDKIEAEFRLCCQFSVIFFNFFSWNSHRIGNSTRPQRVKLYSK